MLARAMTIVILGYAVMGILSCFAIVISTTFVNVMAEFFSSEIGILSAAVFSLLLGIAFILSASVVRFKTFFQVVGVIALLEAPLLLLVPLDFWVGHVEFWLVDNLLVYRIVGIPIGIALFIFIIYSALPGVSPGNKHAQ